MPHGPRSIVAVAHPIRVCHQLSHHLSLIHDRPRRLAGDDRGDAACDRQADLPPGLRFLAEGLRPLVRHGRRHRHRDGLSVRHELERVAERSGPIQGPLLGYEGFTAFMLEATFFGAMLLGRDRVPPWFYFFSCCMVSLGTMLSSFWILCNNSWMQVPLGHSVVDGKIVPDDWWAITTGPIVRVRWPHMLLAAFLTTGMSVIATGAWHMLRGHHLPEARVMLHWGLGVVAVLIPVQMVFGHFNGEYVLNHQPAKFAAIEARWHTQQPATEMFLAIPDPWAKRNLFPILEVPKLGSFIASGDWTAKEIGLEAFPEQDRPPVIITFFAFRFMVGMGLIMVAISWGGLLLVWRGRLENARWFLWAAFLSFSTGFIAVLCGWYTAEVGRQPWVVYGILRTEDAITPSLSGGQVLFSLLAYVAVYIVIYSFGLIYIYRVLRAGPASEPETVSHLQPGR